MHDKRNILLQLSQRKKLVLDLGCGPLKKDKEAIGIDMLDYDCVDIVGDVHEVIKAFPDNSVDSIHSYHFFEHITGIPDLLQELGRVLKPTGFIEVVVPHFSNAYYYSDYTHKNFFGLYSFSYLVQDDLLRRKVPDYNINTGLQLKSVYLRFRSIFYINRPFRALQQMLFNAGTLMQEWYEDSWSRQFPCYEIQFILTKQ